jgi:CO/xanthine dehydrogenase FAD-binding subunit
MRLARPTVVVDINDIPGLSEIVLHGSEIKIGATVRHCQVERSELIKQYLPLLSKAIPLVGHSQIRNRGTLVGSIVHADPSAEAPLAALLLEAVLEVFGPAGTRLIPVSDFFYGYMMTDLQPDEVVTGAIFTDFLVEECCVRGTSFVEIARREGDFALVSAACQLDLDNDGILADARIGVGGVGGVPIRLADIEEYLKGKTPSEQLFREAAEAVGESIEPDEDPFVTADYRRQVAVRLTQRALVQAWEEAVRKQQGEEADSE